MSTRIADILDFLVAKSAAPSTMGAQLDRLRNGVSVPPDPFRAREDTENALLRTASILRCLDSFASRDVFVNHRALEKIQKNCKLSQGYIALSILRAYQEWSSQSQERGLVEVYRVIVRLAPKSVAAPPKDTDEDLLQMFRTNKAKRARSFAAEAYADSLLAMQDFVRTWNKKK